MLSLTRKLKESIKIGERVCVTVARIRQGRVTLRIEAPEDIPVHRQEVYDRISGANGNGHPKEPALARCMGIAATIRTSDGQVVGITEVYPDRIVSRGVPSLTPGGLPMGWAEDGTQRHNQPGMVGTLCSRWLWRANR